MFHGLKAIGGNMSDAYDHFRNYNGKESYDDLKLSKPEPMNKIQSDDDESVWSHMSDYDEFC